MRALKISVTPLKGVSKTTMTSLAQIASLQSYTCATDAKRNVNTTAQPQVVQTHTQIMKQIQTEPHDK
jgi:hypothetical protein